MDLGFFCCKTQIEATVRRGVKKEGELEVNLQLLVAVDQGRALNPQEQEQLNSFLTRLVEDDQLASTAFRLKEMEIKDKNILLGLQTFVITIRPHHASLAEIEKKFDQGARLTTRECGLVDSLLFSDFFARKLQMAGITKNPHINRIVKLNTIAQENNFSDFKDGDVLFYNRRAMDAYNGESCSVSNSIMEAALGTPYTHVGVFYRDAQGRPCVSHITDKHNRQPLHFGMQSFIHVKRVDPVKFTATELDEEARLGAQEAIGSIFARIVNQDWKIKFSRWGGATCILSNFSWTDKTQLGKVKLEHGTKLMCSEFVGTGLMQAFQEFNMEKFLENGEVVALNTPFNPCEFLPRMHPGRFLVAFGPQQGGERVDSGWEEVTQQSEFTKKMLPQASPFPPASYGKGYKVATETI